MQKKQWFSPYDSNRVIGSVIRISSTEVTVNLAKAGTGDYSVLFGNKIAPGEIGQFVFIDVGNTAVLGKLFEVWLDERERLSVAKVDKKPEDNHPKGRIQLLGSFEVSNFQNYKGITQYPRLGSLVYAAHPDLISIICNNIDIYNENSIEFNIAKLAQDDSHTITVTPEDLFSRHCAVIGATGGGKSYTMATLLEEVQKAGGKAIIIDPTGEYESFQCPSYFVGNNPKSQKDRLVTFPHWQFAESDLFALIRPALQTQAPKLGDAIVSLKAVSHCLEENLKSKKLNIDSGTLIKAGKVKKDFEDYLIEHNIRNKIIPWSFEKLSSQVQNECVYETDKYNNTIWGATSDNSISYCYTLMTRLSSLSNNINLKWMIDPDRNLKTIPALIDDFCGDQYENRLLRLDLSSVPFESNAREILVNAIGRHLLKIARNGQISDKKPVLVFIDEAHQFLNKSIGDEYNKSILDAFGNIAKEGRKYGLSVVIATQRPRDIPEDVLSQIGTIITHRLTNPFDQDIVKRSIGTVDNSVTSLLPVLAQGEALILGVGISFPLKVKINMPKNKPKAMSPSFSTAWSNYKNRDFK